MQILMEMTLSSAKFFNSEYGDYYLPETFAIETVMGQELLQRQLMPSNWESPPEYIVTVVNDGTGNKYVIDGIQRDSLDLKEGDLCF